MIEIINKSFLLINDDFEEVEISNFACHTCIQNLLSDTTDIGRFMSQFSLFWPQNCINWTLEVIYSSGVESKQINTRFLTNFSSIIELLP